MTDTPMLDPQFAPLLEGLAQAPAIPTMTPVQARTLWGMIDLGPPPPIAEVRDLVIPGPAGSIPARLYLPGDQPDALIVYYHGGGWVLGNLDMVDIALRDLANDSCVAVLSIAYRLAPEHPFPAAVEDSYAAFVWAAENRAALSCAGLPLALAGDSAGGNLAAVTALAARDRGGPEAAMQILLYPITDARMATPSYSEQETGGLLTAADMRWFWDHYIADLKARSDPLASPIHAENFAGLPPAIIAIAHFDPLRDEGLDYAAKLEVAGVPVTVLHHDTMPHGFFTFGPAVMAARAANRALAMQIRQAIGTQVQG